MQKVKQIITEKRFAESIAVEEKKIEIKPDDVIVEPAYSGPRIEDILTGVTSDW